MTERPLEPDEPEEPEEPTEVSEPTEVVEPAEPEEPTEVVEPSPEPVTEETVTDEPTREQTVPEEDTTAVAAPVPPRGRRLERSRDDRVIAGVCGGLGRHLGIDPVLIRVAALLLIFAGGVGIVLYVIGWLAMPEEPADGVELVDEPADDELERKRGAALLGLVFVVIGIFFLLDEVWPDVSWRYVWPVALIAVGLAIVLRGRR